MRLDLNVEVLRLGTQGSVVIACLYEHCLPCLHGPRPHRVYTASFYRANEFRCSSFLKVFAESNGWLLNVLFSLSQVTRDLALDVSV